MPCTDLKHNELLLQLYRAMSFLTGTLFAIGGASLNCSNSVQLFPLSFLAIGTQWLLWFPVIRARHRLVDLEKHGFVGGKNSLWGVTRIRLDLGWPILLSLYWGTIMFLSFDSP